MKKGNGEDFFAPNNNMNSSQGSIVQMDMEGGLTGRSMTGNQTKPNQQQLGIKFENDNESQSNLQHLNSINSFDGQTQGTN